MPQQMNGYYDDTLHIIILKSDETKFLIDSMTYSRIDKTERSDEVSWLIFIYNSDSTTGNPQSTH